MKHKVSRLAPFWDRASMGDGCWEWLGGRTTEGYGEYRGGYAHRHAYALVRGPIPAGLHVLHHCDNPPCINPAHLFLGTNLDNVRDAQRKGRIPRGEDRHNAKLTEDVVLRLRALRGHASAKTLASVYGVSPSTVRRVWSRASWGWLVERSPVTTGSPIELGLDAR